MRNVLVQCVNFAIQKNAWICGLDPTGEYEITMEDALDFLKEIKE